MSLMSLIFEFPTFFLCITFLSLGFSPFSVIRQIIFVLAYIFSYFYVIRQIRLAQWWLWQWWVWLRVLWYVLFYLAFWKLCLLCQWLGVWCFCTNKSWVQMWHSFVCRICINRSQVQGWLTHRNVLTLKLLLFPSNFKISFVVIVVVWIFRTNSNRCRFTKNIIRRAPMGYVHRPSNPSRGSTKDAAFIRCVDGGEPKIHGVWSLGLDGISHKVNPKVWVEVPAVTVGDFVTEYLAENGRIIHIIGQISINDSVQFLGVSDQAWGLEFPFLCNLQAPVEATVRRSENYFNQYWGGSMFDTNIIINVAWGGSTYASPANSPWSLVNPRASARRIRDDFLCLRCQERLKHYYNWHNNRINIRVHCQDDDREGLVTQ